MSILTNVLKDLLNDITSPSTFNSDLVAGQEGKEKMMENMTDQTIIDVLGQEDFDEALAIVESIGESEFRNMVSNRQPSAVIEPPQLNIIGDTEPVGVVDVDYRIEYIPSSEWFEKQYSRTIEWWTSDNSGIIFTPDNGTCTTITYPSTGQYRINVKMIFTADPTSILAEDFEMAQTILVTLT